MDLRIVFVPPLAVLLCTGMGVEYMRRDPDSLVGIGIAQFIVGLGTLGIIALVALLVVYRNAKNFKMALIASLISAPVTAYLTFFGFMAIGFGGI